MNLLSVMLHEFELGLHENEVCVSSKLPACLSTCKAGCAFPAAHPTTSPQFLWLKSSRVFTGCKEASYLFVFFSIFLSVPQMKNCKTRKYVIGCPGLSLLSGSTSAAAQSVQFDTSWFEGQHFAPPLLICANADWANLAEPISLFLKWWLLYLQWKLCKCMLRKAHKYVQHFYVISQSPLQRLVFRGW